MPLPVGVALSERLFFFEPLFPRSATMSAMQYQTLPAPHLLPAPTNVGRTSVVVLAMAALVGMMGGLVLVAPTVLQLQAAAPSTARPIQVLSGGNTPLGTAPQLQARPVPTAMKAVRAASGAPHYKGSFILDEHVHHQPQYMHQIGSLMLLSGVVLAVLAFLRRPSQTLQPSGLDATWSMAAVTGGKIQKVDGEWNQEEGEVPFNTFAKDNTFKGVVKSVESLVGPGATAEHCKIVLQTDGGIPAREGQCYGVIPPGMDVDPKTGAEKPHYARQYSIASSRYGDDFDGQTTTLCVKKVAWWDKELNGMKKELCSHFLCDATPGTEVTMTGPGGRTMLLDADPDAVHICVCTGTGIAPYRAFWRRMFYENHPNYQFKGKMMVFFGAAVSDELLYAQELADLQATYPDQFSLYTAFSEEQTKADGEKMFVQDRMAEHADEVYQLLNSGAHLYCAGSKFMMPGILEMLEKCASASETNWEEMQEGLKKDGKWHVEVY